MSATNILDAIDAESVRVSVRLLHQVRVVDASLRRARQSQAALEAIIALVVKAQAGKVPDDRT